MNVEVTLQETDARLLLRLLDGRRLDGIVRLPWETRVVSALLCALAECDCGARRA